MIETGIFGGSFNPIHNGHIGLAEELLHNARLDEIWFMVSPQNPLKQQTDLLDDEKRLNLVRKALTDKPGLTVCDYEYRLPRPSYTWDTMQRLKSEHSDRCFTLLIGADNWKLFDRWYRHDEILNSYRIVIYPRIGNRIDTSALPEGVSLVSTRIFDISSTTVRDRIRHGKSVKGLVPDCILEDTVLYYSRNDL